VIRNTPGGNKYPRTRKRIRLAGCIAAIIAVIVVCFVVLRLPKVPKSVPPSAVLDLRPVATSSRDHAPPKRPALPRAKLELSIALPPGSPLGEYEIMFARQAGHSLITGAGEARAIRGKIVLNIRMDLAALSPGEYLFGFRRQSRNWHYYPVAVK
jgi:hypothetical protein